MSFGQAVKHVYGNYANFQGRASRSEFWWFYLYYVIVGLILYVIYFAGLAASPKTEISPGVYEVSMGPLAIIAIVLLGIWWLANLIPTLAVWVRRLHDSDKSGWWMLLIFACGLGTLVLWIFALLPSSVGPNKHGEGPATA
jgi:uncharacterized membrane protein YhaH (DUF805 family)